MHAYIGEMHTELLKHDMRKQGEDDIYETAGMAICMGVVRNYTYIHTYIPYIHTYIHIKIHT
jgi:hypothetical protein